MFSDSRVCDNGNSDIDGIDESNLDMLHELRSEMDFSGHWEDSSSLVNTNKSVLRHKAEWSYTRSAANILQFNRESNGIDNTKRVLDLSPTYHNGNQTATDEDLSYLLNTYSYRLKPSEGYRYVMWKENGAWNKLDANKMDVIDPEICTINPCSGNEKCESTRHSKVRLNIFGSKNDALNTAALGSAKVSWDNLANSADASVVILSKTGLVNDVNAIGLVIPFNSAINKNAVIGVDRKTGTSVFNEDRRINAYYEAGYTNRGKFLTVFARMWHLGLQAPDNGDENIIETLNMEIYHIFGTPIEIYNSAMDINALP
ncbi:hypothetical protein HWQ48_16895 [Shewanella sp. E94]|nr:hypothetical protein [Shewanella sp. E94]